MKTAKEWKKEINEILVSKANELLKNFQVQRDKGFEELATLSEQLEGFQKKRTELIASQEAETKQFIPSNGVLEELARKIHYRSKDIADIQNQIDQLFKKMVELPKSVQEIYPFVKLLS